MLYYFAMEHPKTKPSSSETTALTSPTVAKSSETNSSSSSTASSAKSSLIPNWSSDSEIENEGKSL